MDCPSDLEPAEIECPECGGNGCVECDDTGVFELRSCPQRFVGDLMYDVLHYAALFEKGITPVEGGALDQTNWFVAAARFAWGEQAALKPPQPALNL